MSSALTSQVDFTLDNLPAIAEAPPAVVEAIEASKLAQGSRGNGQIRRFTRHDPCPICDGCERAPRGKQVRCYGFLSDDRAWAHCTREEYAGPLPRNQNSNAYAHRLNGPCGCGKEHGPSGESENGNPRSGKVEVYDYAGFQVVRGVPKSFWQRRPDPTRPGEFINSLKAVPEKGLDAVEPVLYREAELRAADPGAVVWIPEGEKHVDAVRGLGLVATCNPMGAGQWRPAYSAELQGRDVVILPDNDDPGRDHAEDIARSIKPFAQSVRILPLPGLREKGDVLDWLAAGGTVEEIRRLALDCPAICTTPPTTRPVFEVVSARELMSRKFAESREIVPGVVPEGLMTLTARPKSGKTIMVLGMEIAVAAGGYAFGHIAVDQGDVLGIHLEDGEELMQERLNTLLAGAEVPEHLDYVFSAPTLKNGLIDYVKEWILSRDNPRLTVVDTIQRVRTAPRPGVSQYADDYATLACLSDLAHEYRLCILCLMHSRKMAADDVHDEMSGTLGLFGAADGSAVLKRVRGQNDATLHISGRRIRDDLSLAMRYHPESAAWEILGPAAEHIKTQERQAIVDLLTDGPPEGLTPKEIAEAVNKPHGAIKTLMFKMRNAGQLTSARGKYTIAEVPV